MPYITLSTNGGPVDFHYQIATPKSHSADSIDSALPTILFIHGAYTSDEIFEPQFADPQLRQFNLITMQMRGYGLTRGSAGSETYTPKESADDIVNLIEALDLPPLHIFAISIGTTVALEVAARRPQQILSMTLCSPLSPVEIDSIAAGRLEVYGLWKDAHTFEKNADSTTKAIEVDEEYLHEVLIGAAQLLWNNIQTKLTIGITNVALDHAMKQWAMTKEKIHQSYKYSVGWPLSREPISNEALSKITCPISIIHFQHDIAYPLEFAHDLAEQLRSSNAQPIPVYSLPGPHLGNVTNEKEVNAILQNMVISAEFDVNKRYITKVEDTGDTPLRTPFTDLLSAYGYNPFKEDSSEEETDE